MSNVIKLKNKPRILKTDFGFEAENQNEINQNLDAELQYKKELENQYNIGFGDGFATAKEKLENEFNSELISKSEEFYKILSSFEEKLFTYETAFNEIISTLSIKIAEKIIKSQITFKTNIEETIRESARKIIGANEILIRLHPTDYEVLVNDSSKNLIENSFTKIKFEINDTIEPGGCYIESEIGNVDARIKTQLEEIEKTFDAYKSNLNEQDGNN